MSQQFVRFSMVGALGFLVDAGVLHLLIAGAGGDLYVSRLLSFLAAASFTWAMNRRFTFDPTDHHAGHQWIRFIAVNGIGGAINYAVYAFMVATLPLVAALPVLGVAAGSLAGLAVNFTASRTLVFGRTRAAGRRQHVEMP